MCNFFFEFFFEKKAFSVIDFRWLLVYTWRGPKKVKKMESQELLLLV